MNLEKIREWQFTMMEKNIDSIANVIRMADARAITSYRDNGTGWTALETLCHLRDFETIFLERARITVEQENGALPFPKPDELAADRAYNGQNVEVVLTEWRQNRAALLAYLRARDEGDWARTAIHPVRGVLSLMDQVLLAASHDANHLEQITRTLIQKKTNG
jgi:hypothetical protein